MTGAVRAGLDACGVGAYDRVLVACSGGLDSTVLLRSLAALGRPAVAAHVDHGLRESGGGDAAFVEALAADLGLEAAARRVAVAEGNVQAEARRARYAALAEMARDHGCAAVATGHTATDQAETVLMALVRGAGLRGLAGMPRRRSLAEGVDLVRPLLAVPRADVEAAAREAGWTWREDPSNATDAYRRNRLRHTVLPVLRAEAGPGLDVRIAASAGAARAGLSLVRQAVGASRPDPARLGLEALRGLDPGVLRLVLAEAAADWAPGAERSRALVERLEALLDAEVGTRVEAGGVAVWRERDALRVEAPGRGLGGRLEAAPLEGVPEAFPPSPWEEVVDAGALRGPVEVRGWREGDRIRPVGLDGSKLVADLLRERGVPAADRPRVPVVVVGGEVAWVVGHRLAAGVAVGASTRRAVRWTWRREGG